MPDLAAIRERLEKATPGPWVHLDVSTDQTSIVLVPEGYGPIGTPLTKETEQFMMHAPTDIDTLLSKVDEQHAEIERLRGAVKKAYWNGAEDARCLGARIQKNWGQSATRAALRGSDE